MTTIERILLLALIALVMINTVSYALWNWKENNKTGATFVFLLCLVTIAFQVYMLFIRA